MNKQNKIIPFIPNGDFYFAKGVEAFRNRKFDLAVKWIQKAIELEPNEPLYQCQLSIIYTEIGSFHKANQLLTNVLQSTKETYTDCYYLLANNYAHLGLLNDAKKYALLYLDNDPNGDFCDETKELLHLIEIDEEEHDDWEFEDEDELLIYQESAFYYIENMEWERAIGLLEEMMTLFPEHKTTKHEYAYALFFSGNKEEAVQVEQQNLQEDSTLLYSHANLALFYYEMGQTREYKQHIRALLNIYPIHEQQKLRIAVTMARTGLYNQATMRFRMLNKRIVSSHISYYRWYASSLYYSGFQKRANLIWKEGCKVHQVMLNETPPWENEQNDRR